MEGEEQNIALWFIAVSLPYLTETGWHAHSIDKGKGADEGDAIILTIWKQTARVKYKTMSKNHENENVRCHKQLLSLCSYQGQ